jgi:lipopolysaccharide transport system ATP-binding protein
MSKTVISVENISKQYRLGEVGTGTLSHDLNKWWYKARGKEDPYLRIGEANDRASKAESDYVWALKDINFEVKQGEVLGIIGRNGAGKSTLLKILSKTTTPTTGSIKVKGRIASLLEVGTGFHPEMTGRENIYLNGAILGMTRREINSKFDEIVDFAGIERYIDTPVKRYSSGMYVRLAFAVAAHLEPEILIVDEVLAVGDAEFQKKCLGKMKNVSVNEGRTVLFVSHNMSSVRNLCTRGIMLAMGSVITDSSLEKCIETYLNVNVNSIKNILNFDSIKYISNEITLENVFINNSNNYINVIDSESFSIEILGYASVNIYLDLELKFKDQYGNNFAFFSDFLNTGNFQNITKGNFKLNYVIKLPKNLNKNTFYVDLAFSYPGHVFYLIAENFFEIDYLGKPTFSGKIFSSDGGSGYLFLK